MLFLLLACGTPKDNNPTSVADDGCVHPDFSDLAPFPSDQLATEDGSSPTGIRLHFEASQMPLSRKGEALVDPALLEGFDGFSRIAPVVIGLTEAVDPAAFPAYSEDSSAPAFLLNTETQAIIRSRLAVSKDGRTLTLWPDTALAPATLHATVLSSDLPTSSCFSGGPVLAELEQAGNSFSEKLATAKSAAEAAGAASPAAIPFTTRSLVGEARAMVSLRAQMPALATAMTFETVVDCTTDTLDGYCGDGVHFAILGTAALPKWQDANGVFQLDTDGAPLQQGTEDVHFWLRTPMVDNAPVLVLQHGLGANKEGLLGLSNEFLAAGYATIAIDAVAHGERPHEGDTTSAFFGIGLDRWHVETARDNIRQTASDHLGLLLALKASSSLFPTGMTLDTGNLSYLGQSLGGIIGSNSCALNPDLDRCVLNVPGGRLVEIIRANAAYSSLLGIYFDLTSQFRELELFSALAQSVVDEGDPALVGARIVMDDPARPLLVQEATNDETVPNQTTEVMARSMGLPLLQPSFEGIVGLSEATMPAADNLETPSGMVTAGMAQFQESHAFLTSGGPEAERAIRQILGFLEAEQIDAGN